MVYHYQIPRLNHDPTTPAAPLPASPPQTSLAATSVVAVSSAAAPSGASAKWGTHNQCQRSSMQKRVELPIG